MKEEQGMDGRLYDASYCAGWQADLHENLGDLAIIWLYCSAGMAGECGRPTSQQRIRISDMCEYI